MAVCSAACAAPGRFTPLPSSASRWPAEMVHQTARVRSARGRQVENILVESLAGLKVPPGVRGDLPQHRRTSPKCTAASPPSQPASSR